jgi:hypothetical protein
MSKHNRERRQREGQSSYLDRILDSPGLGTLQAASVYRVDVLHDSWCNLLAGTGPSNCNPDVRPLQRIPFLQDN